MALALGMLLTFVQFIFVAIIGLPGQLDRTRPPFFLKANKVPIRRWLVNIVLFFSINSLNNHAFSYDISVPVHIILRSGGSITTMIAGSLYGKRYSRIQIIAVLLLTVGVITAAVSDSQSKVRRFGLADARRGLTRKVGLGKRRSTEKLQLWDWPGDSVHCADPVSDHGPLHRGDIPDIRASVEGEPVLLAPSLPAPIRPLFALAHQAVHEARKQPPAGTSASYGNRLSEPVARASKGAREHTDPKPTVLSCPERAHAVCLHSGCQPPSGCLVGAHSDHCPQHPQAGQPVVEHMAVWKPACIRDAGGCNCCLFSGRTVLSRRWEEKRTGEEQSPAQVLIA
jgi:hypothetical protein